MTAPPNKIILHLGHKGWLATFVGPHAAKIAKLFDTCTLPLPWTSQAPLEKVLADVQGRNPGVIVETFS